MTLTVARFPFWLGCGIEAALALVALAAGHWTGVPVAGAIRARGLDLVWGLVLTGPLLLVLVWCVKSRWTELAALRRFLEERVRPALGSWAVWQLGVLSLLAGLGEELLFRAFLMGLLASEGSVPLALGISSLAFGLAHWVNRAYLVLATVMGLYLGALYLATGNLLTPVVAHAAYDFAALIYLLRWRRPEPTSATPEEAPPG